MHQITLILLLSLLLPDCYIYLVYVVHRTRNRWWRALYWLPTVILTAIFGYFLTLSGHNTLAHHAHDIGILAIAVMFCAVPKMTFMCISLLGIICRGLGRCLSALCLHTPFTEPRPPFRVHRAPFTLTGSLLAVFCAAGIIYGAVWGVRRLEVNHVTFASPRLPQSFDGYKIVQLSDIHLGSWTHQPEVIAELVEKVNAQQPDLILFTGDLVNQQSRELEPFVPLLSQLKARHGVYSVLGNHDYGTYYHWRSAREEAANLALLRRMQAQMGWHLLDNEHVLKYQDTDSIALVGCENDGEPPFSQHADLGKAVASSDSLFSILLTHNPTHWRREVLPTTRIDLTLSGHTHAMQSAILGYSLAALRYPEWSGWYHEGHRALYVNIGIGYVGLPFRIGAWPEITVIKLEHKTPR